MVLYFIQPSPRPEDVKNPRAMLGAYNAFKFFQWGLVAGLGVGLLRCRRLLEKNGGRIEEKQTFFFRGWCDVVVATVIS